MTRSAGARRTTLLLAIASLIGATAATPEDLEGFTLRDWNKMECQPQQLRADAVLNIELPKKPSSYLSILTPGGRYFSVIEPWTQLDLMRSSDELAKLTKLSINTSEAKGYETRMLEPVFVAAGTYMILVGTQFETERPIVNGWCRVAFHPGS